MLVWVDGWQQECCPEPFVVGSQVEWEVASATDGDWLSREVGDELAAQVTHVEDRHELHVDGELRVVVGRVERIRMVGHDESIVVPERRWGWREREIVRMAGPTQVVDVRAHDDWFATSGTLSLTGYLVDLRPMEG